MPKVQGKTLSTHTHATTTTPAYRKSTRKTSSRKAAQPPTRTSFPKSTTYSSSSSSSPGIDTSSPHSKPKRKGATRVQFHRTRELIDSFCQRESMKPMPAHFNVKSSNLLRASICFSKFFDQSVIDVEPSSKQTTTTTSKGTKKNKTRKHINRDFFGLVTTTQRETLKHFSNFYRHETLNEPTSSSKNGPQNIATATMETVVGFRKPAVYCTVTLDYNDYVAWFESKIADIAVSNSHLKCIVEVPGLAAGLVGSRMDRGSMDRAMARASQKRTNSKTAAATAAAKKRATAKGTSKKKRTAAKKRKKKKQEHAKPTKQSRSAKKTSKTSTKKTIALMGAIGSLGSTVQKRFVGFGVWTGTIVQHVPTRMAPYLAQYEDGSEEWYTMEELMKYSENLNYTYGSNDDFHNDASSETVPSPKKITKARMWTKKEEELLVMGVNRHHKSKNSSKNSSKKSSKKNSKKSGVNWKAIATQFVLTRNDMQCRTKWQRMQQKNGNNKATGKQKRGGGGIRRATGAKKRKKNGGRNDNTEEEDEEEDEEELQRFHKRRKTNGSSITEVSPKPSRREMQREKERQQRHGHHHHQSSSSSSLPLSLLEPPSSPSHRHDIIDDPMHHNEADDFLYGYIESSTPSMVHSGHSSHSGLSVARGETSLPSSMGRASLECGGLGAMDGFDPNDDASLMSGTAVEDLLDGFDFK